MSIPSSSNTGFEDPGERARRLLPTSLVIWEIKANAMLGREVTNVAAFTLQSFKELTYELAVHDDYLGTTDDKVRQLQLARTIALKQRNLPGVSDYMVKKYDQHIKNLDWLLNTYNQGWAQRMFPMLDYANQNGETKK